MKLNINFRLPFVTRKTHEKASAYMLDQLSQSHKRNLELERELRNARRVGAIVLHHSV